MTQIPDCQNKNQDLDNINAIGAIKHSPVY